MTTGFSPAMAQRIELWPVKRLVPFERNARTHDAAQLEQLQASIRQFGFTAPILVDGEAGILAGHGRLEAAKLLGMAEVPVVVLDHLSPEQRRAYVIADNKLAENAGWDDARLAAELEELLAGDFDLSAMGFSAEDLARLGDGLELGEFEELSQGFERAEPEQQPAGLGLDGGGDEGGADVRAGEGAGGEAVTVKGQPVSKVRWLPREKLRGNAYNPNHVAAPELELLITSILEDGWTQPIVTLPQGEDGMFQIVDGFHRWTVSADPRVAALTGGQVPTVQVGLDPVHRMMSTIRHNRARGTHAVVRMAEIVRRMVDEGIPAKEIQKRLGMEREEVERLVNRAGMPSQVRKVARGFNQAWVPGKG